MEEIIGKYKPRSFKELRRLAEVKQVEEARAQSNIQEKDDECKRQDRDGERGQLEEARM